MVVVNVINELLIELPLFKLMLLGIIHLKMKMEMVKLKWEKPLIILSL